MSRPRTGTVEAGRLALTRTGHDVTGRYAPGPFGHRRVQSDTTRRTSFAPSHRRNRSASYVTTTTWATRGTNRSPVSGATDRSTGSTRSRGYHESWPLKAIDDPIPLTEEESEQFVTALYLLQTAYGASNQLDVDFGPRCMSKIGKELSLFLAYPGTSEYITATTVLIDIVYNKALRNGRRYQEYRWVDDVATPLQQANYNLGKFKDLLSERVDNAETPVCLRKDLFAQETMANCQFQEYQALFVVDCSLPQYSSESNPPLYPDTPPPSYRAPRQQTRRNPSPQQPGTRRERGPGRRGRGRGG